MTQRNKANQLLSRITNNIPIVLEKKQMPSTWSILFVYIISIVVALSIGGIFLAYLGHNPIAIYSKTFSKVFGTGHGIAETLVKAIPLYLGAFGVSVAARMQLWNIGVEGQFLFGAFTASGVALTCHSLPPYILLPLMLLAGFLGGALLSLIAAIPRVYLGVSEIITTLLFNYIIVLWIAYFVHGPWKDPNTSVPQTVEFTTSARLPVIIPSTRVHMGIIIVILCAILLDYLLKRTGWGYCVRAVGDNLRAAKISGVNIHRHILMVMLVSGGLAGMGGMIEVSGTLHRLQSGIFPLYTLTAFMIAWLARLSIWGIFVVGYFIAGLLVSGYVMQMMGLPSALVSVIQGIILFSAIAFQSLSFYRVSIKPSDKEINELEMEH